ncbi:hypothetical protein [Nostoc sp. TCL26-01]|uniref:hypothetical protein n=1 Tax=Nostoc sp. TCL26-01 TaxID=2576904 RepID=UPI0015BF8332|nr:hypothetical protein [Nostoc sp. TCL26-01]QLE57646.1 hypothetical protein FD725_20280 [Nostoc sp. TCL26-01]
MLRVYHLIIGVILIALIPLGAKFVLPLFSTTKDPKSSSVVTPTKTINSQPTALTSSKSKQGNIWKKLLGSNSAPNGWEIIPCEGNEPLLCVSAKGVSLGTVAAELYPAQNDPNFQKHLTESSIPLGSKLDYQNPTSQTKLVKALQSWVADSYTAFAKNHQAKYGNKVIFSNYPPQQVTIGQLPGMRYGFVGIKPEGGIQEQYIGYVTYDGTTLYVINTSFNPASITGKFANLEDLGVFQPYLSAIAENLNLPIRERSAQP